MLFDWPSKAAYGRPVPKNAIYEHGHVKTALKELFVNQVDRIVWEYKLAPETINIPASDAVREIQVFSVTVRDDGPKDDVLRCIDRSIPFPLLFELRRPGQISYAATYKRPSEADGSAWVMSGYFTSGWMPEDSPRMPLPLALNMERLYAALLAPLLPYLARQGEGLTEYIDRIDGITNLRTELERCEKKLHREKQFNRKVPLNQEVRRLQKQLAALMASDDP